MSKQQTGPAEPAAVSNVLDKLIVDLGGKASDDARTAARKLASEVIAARGWELLPSRFKSAVRDDVGSLSKASKPDPEAIAKAGWSSKVAKLALRDLGRY